MKAKITLCIISVCVQLSIAQQMPLEFEDNPADTFQAFLNSGFSFNTDPQASSNAVGQFFNDGSQASQGFFIDLLSPIDLNSQQTIGLRFYSFDPNQHNILLKLENGDDIDIQVKETFSVPSPSDWTIVTFDFSNAQSSIDGSFINATGSYNRLTIFIDQGQTTPGTYLIDDIDDGVTPPDPHALDVVYTDLVWSDEFEIDGSVNSINWFHQTQLPTGGNGSWFNGELQHYTNRIDNSFVEDGFLNIVAINEEFDDGIGFTDQNETKQYTSARLNSKFAFTYGRIDVRAKLPFGDGTWPAIWTLGKNINEDGAYWDNQGFGTTIWPACGEIDVMEHGLGTINHVSSALHSPSSSGNTINTQSFVLNDVANDFHVYSVNWSPDQITFLIDGVGFYTYNPNNKNDANWPFYQDQYILLNIAMGGIAGTVDPNFDTSNMVIDYVRVYQNSTLSLEPNFENQFIVSPNPASNFIKITTQKSINFVEVFDVLGQKVMRQDNNYVINVSKLQSGMYILKIYSDGLSATKKILVD